MTGRLSLKAQYYRLFRDVQPYGVRESEFGWADATLSLPLEATALVLVDCWNMHYCASWIERAERVMRTRIVPVLDAARGIGMTVVHAPSPEVAAWYPQSSRYASPKDKAAAPVYAERDGTWPPKAFADRTGPYKRFRRQSTIPAKYYVKKYKAMRIHPLVTPLDDEFVIATGAQMHRLLKGEKLLHLIYAGFATNMCVQYRDYGVRAMSARGYNIVALRDCTTAVEFHDTVRGEWAKKVALFEIGYQFGYSTESRDFVAACRRLRKT